jgi:two-component system response regulator AtoC
MEFERVGGKDRVKVNARIMAATNKDLKLMVKEGRFRDDLYYRLNIVSINLPPLRSRRQDIPPLIDYLLSKINLDLHKKIIGVSGEMMDKFMNYEWPGNIRELENLLVRACVVAKGQVLGVGDFPELGKDSQSITAQDDQTSEVFKPEEPGKFLTLDQVEERYIRKIIKETDKNKGEVCETLGISRPTFERKLEKYGISFERE